MRILQNLLRTKYNSIANNYFASNAKKMYKTNKKVFHIMKREFSNYSNENIKPPNNNIPPLLFIIIISSYTFWQSRKPPAEPTPVVPWLINLHAR